MRESLAAGVVAERRQLVPLAVMARRAGVSVCTVKRWESGERMPRAVQREVYERVVRQYAEAGGGSTALSTKRMRSAWSRRAAVVQFVGAR